MYYDPDWRAQRVWRTLSFLGWLMLGWGSIFLIYAAFFWLATGAH